MNLKCPLTSTVNSHMRHYEWAPCLKHKCAWWFNFTPDEQDDRKMEGECGILTIVKSLRKDEK